MQNKLASAGIADTIAAKQKLLMEAAKRRRDTTFPGRMIAPNSPTGVCEVQTAPAASPLNDEHRELIGVGTRD